MFGNALTSSPRGLSSSSMRRRAAAKSRPFTAARNIQELDRIEIGIDAEVLGEISSTLRMASGSAAESVRPDEFVPVVGLGNRSRGYSSASSCGTGSDLKRPRTPGPSSQARNPARRADIRTVALADMVDREIPEPSWIRPGKKIPRDRRREFRSRSRERLKNSA